jgi:ABC-type phosphate transport system substrate-binding protein
MKKLTSLALVAVVGSGLVAAPAASAGQLKIGGSTGAALLIQTAATQFNKANKSKGITAGQYAGVGSGGGHPGGTIGT